MGKNDSNFILKLKIPNGTEAKVDMPILNSDEKNKKYPRIKFKKIYADNIYDLKEDNKKITFKLKEGGDYKFNYEIGESGWIKLRFLSSCQNFIGISYCIIKIFSLTWSGFSIPGITVVTKGWKSGNCIAAALRGTLCLSQIFLIELIL